MISGFWKDTIIQGTASYGLATKLFRLKNERKKWTKEVGLKEEEHVTDLLSELAKFDLIETESGLDSEGKEKRNKLRLKVADRMHW